MGLRRIILIIITVLATGGVVYLAFQYVKDMSASEPDPLTVVPDEAIIILETDDPDNLWDMVSNRSIIWESLKQNEYFAIIHETGVLLDSMVARTESFDALFENNRFVLSVHSVGKNKQELFMSCLGQGLTLEDLKKAISEASFIGATLDPVTIAGTEGYVLNTSVLGQWTFTVSGDMIRASTSTELLEQSLRKNTGELPEQLQFVRTEKELLDKAVGRVYVKYHSLAGWASGLLGPGQKSIIQNGHDLAGWAALDLYLGQDNISLHGMSTFDETSLYRVFMGQDPVDFRISELIPENTATLMAFGISDREKFLDSYRKIIYGTKAETHLEELEAQSSRYGSDFEHDLLSWMGQEVAVFSTETADTNVTEHQYIAIAIDPMATNPGSTLRDLSYTVASYFAEELDTLIYRGTPIRSIHLPVDYSFLFGQLFASVNNPHYAIIDDFVVFANSANALKRLIRERSYKTLSEDVHFNRFMENNLSSESNVLVYSNVSRSSRFFRSKLNEKTSTLIDSSLNLLAQFEGAAWQMITTGDSTFYSNIALAHNPQEKEERLTLWEVELDHMLASNPETIYNHRTKTREVVVVDTSHTMYLVSNTGNLKWKRKIDGEIMGPIRQVDIFNNGKLQMLFNTESKLYMVDILGRDVSGFPVDLRAPASSPVAVFDYEKNHDYRFVIGLMDHTTTSIDKEGKPVTGWNFIAKAPIDVMPVHHRIENKDYIILADNENRIYVTDRRGESRYEAKAKMENRMGTAWFESTSDINTCRFIYRDSTGSIIRIKLDGNRKKVNLPGLKSYSWFTYRDMAGDRGVDYVYSMIGGMRCFSRTEKQFFGFDLTSAEDMDWHYVNRGDEATFVIFMDPVTGEVGVIDRQGERYNEVPVIGYGGATIDDLSADGMFEVITGGMDGHLYAYPVR